MFTSLILTGTVVVSLSFDANRRQCQILKENSDLWLAEEKMRSVGFLARFDDIGLILFVTHPRDSYFRIKKKK